MLELLNSSTDNLELTDGSRIAVVGGGPSGSFFSYFALDFASRLGIEIGIDIIEAKDFTCTGPPGCNRCGGIISESLIQMLSTEGIVLPSKVVRRGIESYTLHLEQGTTVIETPLKEQRIASVYRGAGPLNSVNTGYQSFDNYLLDLCREKGANLIIDRVIELVKETDGIIIKTRNSPEKKYDLVVGATGLNISSSQLFGSICPSYVPPETTRTYISEMFLGEDKIDAHFGNSMHVFLLNIPSITFGALIPKGQYVTLVLLGNEINMDVVEDFIGSTEVKSCFPPDIDIKEITHCNCFPKINISAAKTSFADRVVMIGDSSASKLYKNGIGAAFLTAKAAARIAIFEGISKKSFKKYFEPICTNIHRDNNIGKIIFFITKFIQRSSFLKYGLFSMVIKEQKKPGDKRPMSGILWDTFTGSAEYRNILLRFMNPLLLLQLLWNLVSANLIRNKINKR